MDIGHLFPNRGRTWILFVLLLGSNYFFYYYILYPGLLYVYSNNFEEGPLIKLDQVNITFRKPVSISESVEGNLWITIENQNMVYENVVVTVYPQQHYYNFLAVFLEKTDLALSQPLEESMLHNYLSADVPPKGVVTGVFHLYTKVNKSEIDIKEDKTEKKLDIANSEKIILIVCAYTVKPGEGNSSQEKTSLFDSQNQALLTNKIVTSIISTKKKVTSIPCPSCNKIELTMDRNKVFIHSLIEILLLPPWSNGLLAVVSLIIINILQVHIPSEIEKSEIIVTSPLQRGNQNLKKRIVWIKGYELFQFFLVCISLALWITLFFSSIVSLIGIPYNQLIIPLNDKNLILVNNILRNILTIFIDVISHTNSWWISIIFILVIYYALFIWKQLGNNDDGPVHGGENHMGRPPHPSTNPRRGTPPGELSDLLAHPQRGIPSGKTSEPSGYPGRGTQPGRSSNPSGHAQRVTLPGGPSDLSGHLQVEPLPIPPIKISPKDEDKAEVHEPYPREEPSILRPVEGIESVPEKIVAEEELADLTLSSQVSDEILESLDALEIIVTQENEEIQGTEPPLDSAIEFITEQSVEEHTMKGEKEEIDNYLFEAAPVEKKLDDQEQVTPKPEMIAALPLEYQEPAEQMVVCPVCETKNEQDRTTCQRCGYELVCPRCKKILDSPVEYCTNCGYALDLAKALVKIRPEIDHKG